MEASALSALLMEQQQFVLKLSLPPLETNALAGKEPCKCCMSLMTTFPATLYSQYCNGKTSHALRGRQRRERQWAATNDSVQYCQCLGFHFVV
jgi:hypothetical protein